MIDNLWLYTALFAINILFSTLSYLYGFSKGANSLMTALIESGIVKEEDLVDTENDS